MPQMRSHLPVVGIDFGTTNSSMALATDAGVQLASFSTCGEDTFSFRSVLYLEQVKEKSGVRRVHSFTGPAAIEHYLEAEKKGRLIQSLKSWLPSRTFTGTSILGRHYTLERLVSQMLSALRENAERQFGTPIRHALVGRPVRFVGAESEADDAYAISRLRSAFASAGFEHVDFEFEPVAAAYAYESTLNHDELIFIGDFGGEPATSRCYVSDPASGAADVLPRTCSAKVAWRLPAMPSMLASSEDSFLLRWDRTPMHAP
jgi:hypothetical chaperone protein